MLPLCQGGFGVSSNNQGSSGQAEPIKKNGVDCDRSGSTWTGRLLRKLIDRSCKSSLKKRNQDDYKHHCILPFPPALGHACSWERLVQLFVQCFERERMGHKLLVQWRVPFDNIISKTLTFPWDPVQLLRFGMEIYKNEEDAPPCELVPLLSFKDHGLRACSMPNQSSGKLVVPRSLYDNNTEQLAVLKDELLEYGKLLEVFAYVRWHFALRQAARITGRQVLTIDYHDVLQNPANILEEALRFCGIRTNYSAISNTLAREAPPKQQVRSSSGHSAYIDYYTSRELLWVSEILQFWDPRTLPWLLEPTSRRKQWAICPEGRGRESTWKHYLRGVLASTSRATEHI